LWTVVSSDAIDFIQKLIVRDPSQRLTAEAALEHKWIKELGPHNPQPLPSTVMRRLQRFANENKFKQAAKRVIASILPTGEIEGLAEIFKEFDIDGDGMLSLSELKVGLEKKLLETADGEPEGSSHTSMQDAQLFLQSLDSDGDGVVNVDEFIAATMKEQQYLTHQRIHMAFETFDTDQSKSLNMEEITQALGGDNLAKNIMLKFDKDGDGEISFDEFMEVMNAKE
jgi:calcium-dependent protein kinase